MPCANSSFSVSELNSNLALLIDVIEDIRLSPASPISAAWALGGGTVSVRQHRKMPARTGLGNSMARMAAKISLRTEWRTSHGNTRPSWFDARPSHFNDELPWFNARP